MKDKTQELNLIIEEVKKALGLKVRDMVNKESFKNDIHLTINNINAKIEALENYALEVKSLFSSKPDIIVNFRKRATDIKQEIDLVNGSK